MTITDTPLWGETIEDTKVLSHRNDPETSREAAAKQTDTEKVKLAILSLLRDSGTGLTAFEACRIYFDMRDQRGWPNVQPYSINRRMSDLHREGRVTDTGRRGVTPSGSTAVIWTVAA